MTAQREQAVAMEDAWAGQNLAQFEPDPEGYDASVTQAGPVAPDACAAPELHRPRGHPHRGLRAHELGHRGGGAEGAPRVLEMGRPAEEHPAGLEPHRHLRERALHSAKPRARTPAPLPDVGDRLL